MFVLVVATSAAIGAAFLSVIELPGQTGEGLFGRSPSIPRMWSPDRGQLQMPAAPPAERATAEQSRMAEEASLREQEAQSQARREAFGRLRQRLEQKGHLPLKADVNLENQLEETVALCKLDGAEVEVSLPTNLGKVALIADKRWQLQCKPTAGNAWLIVATADDAAGKPIEIGRVEAKQDELALTLLEMPTVRDPLWVAAREAVTTAPLVLRLPGEKSQEFETFVQPCMPKRLAPIRLDGLLTDEAWLAKEVRQKRVAGVGPLPGAIWPCRMELEGKGLNGIRGEVITPSVTRDAAAPPPFEFRAEWTLPGEQAEPFMETTLSLNNVSSDSTVAGRPLAVGMLESHVLAPWSTSRRLGELGDVGRGERPRICQLPKPGAFRDAPPERPADSSIQMKCTVAMLAQYAEVGRQYVPVFPYGEFVRSLAVGMDEATSLTMAEWQGKIRERLRKQENYRNWVRRVAPPPVGASPEGRGRELEFAQWQQMKHKHEVFLKAGASEVERYWDELKRDLTRHDTEAPEVILCCLHFELEPVLKEKRLAKRLLEAVGDGTVEFTGKLWAEPAVDGRYKVLLAEFAGSGVDLPP